MSSLPEIVDQIPKDGEGFPEWVPVFQASDLISEEFQRGERCCASEWMYRLTNHSTCGRTSCPKWSHRVRAAFFDAYVKTAKELFPKRFMTMESIIQINDNVLRSNKERARVLNAALQRLGYDQVSDL